MLLARLASDAVLDAAYKWLCPRPRDYPDHADGSDSDLWSARDALVLKAYAIVLADVLPVSPRCTHIKGHGGAKAAVRQVMAGLGDTRSLLLTAGSERPHFEMV